MHSCPDCGQACYCCGDIDDCDVGDVQAEIGCEHCPLDGEADADWEDGECCGALPCQWGPENDPPCGHIAPVDSRRPTGNDGDSQP